MNVRRFLVFLAFCLPLLLAALAAVAQTPVSYPVTRIVDGDTIVINLDGKSTTVRLIGVDTPESVDPRKPVEYFAKEASAFTRKLLAGESVTLEYDWQKADNYGRTLAFVFRAKDKLLVNREVIRQGYGHALLRYPFDKGKMADFAASEKEAREANRGLWGCGVGEKPQVFGGETVYVTASGKKDHANGCQFLAKSSIPATLDDCKKRCLSEALAQSQSAIR